MYVKVMSRLKPFHKLENSPLHRLSIVEKNNE